MATSTISMFDFLTAVEKGELTTEVKAKATAEKAKILVERAKAAKKRAEKAKENNPLKAKISAFLAKSPNFANAVGTELGVSTSKASYLLRDMETEGFVTSVMAKAPNAKSKSKQYTLIKEFVVEDEGEEVAED